MNANMKKIERNQDSLVQDIKSGGDDKTPFNNFLHTPNTPLSYKCDISSRTPVHVSRLSLKDMRKI